MAATLKVNVAIEGLGQTTFQLTGVGQPLQFVKEKVRHAHPEEFPDGVALSYSRADGRHVVLSTEKQFVALLSTGGGQTLIAENGGFRDWVSIASGSKDEDGTGDLKENRHTVDRQPTAGTAVKAPEEKHSAPEERAQLDDSEDDRDLFEFGTGSDEVVHIEDSDPMEYANHMIDTLQQTQTSVESVAGKDIVILLGSTGVGKSTAVNFLGGCKMEKTLVNTNHDYKLKKPTRKHAGPSQVLSTNRKYSFDTDDDDDMEERIVAINPLCEIGHALTESETALVNCIDLKEAGFTICDAPGFEDTKGDATDFANAVSISNAMKNCKSFKVLFLVNGSNMLSKSAGYHEFHKGIKGLTNFLNPIAKIAPSVALFFTHVDQEEYTKLRRNVKQHCKKFENDKKRDASDLLCFLYNWMKPLNGNLVMNPLHKEGTKPYLQIIKNLTPVNPAKVEISFPLKNWQISIINRAFDVLSNLITEALSNHNYDQVKKRFRKLSILADRIEFERFLAKKNERLKGINEHIHEMGSAAMKILQVNDHWLSENEVANLGSLLYNLGSAKANLKKTSGVDIRSVARVSKQVNEFVDAMIIEIPALGVATYEFNSRKMLRDLTTLQLLTTQPKLKKFLRGKSVSAYSDSCRNIAEFLQAAFEKASSEIKRIGTNPPTGFESLRRYGNNLAKLFDIIFTAHDLESHISRKCLHYDKTRLLIFREISQMSSLCCEFVQKLYIKEKKQSGMAAQVKGILTTYAKPKQLRSLRQAFFMLWMIEKSDLGEKHMIELKNKFNELYSSFETTVKGLINEVDRLISLELYNDMGSHVDLLTFLAKVDIQEDTNKLLSYQLSKLVQRLCHEFERAKDAITEHKYQTVANCIVHLQQTARLDFRVIDTKNNEGAKASNISCQKPETQADVKKEKEHSNDKSQPDAKDRKMRQLAEPKQFCRAGDSHSQLIEQMERELADEVKRIFDETCVGALRHLEDGLSTRTDVKPNKGADRRTWPSERTCSSMKKFFCALENIQTYRPVFTLLSLDTAYKAVEDRVTTTVTGRTAKDVLNNNVVSAIRSRTLFEEFWFLKTAVKLMQGMTMLPSVLSPAVKGMVKREEKQGFVGNYNHKTIKVHFNPSVTIGVHIKKIDGKPVIIKVELNSQASSQGVKSGWKILQCGRTPVHSKRSVEKVIRDYKQRGKKKILFICEVPSELTRPVTKKTNSSNPQPAGTFNAAKLSEHITGQRSELLKILTTEMSGWRVQMDSNFTAIRTGFDEKDADTLLSGVAGIFYRQKSLSDSWTNDQIESIWSADEFNEMLSDIRTGITSSVEEIVTETKQWTRNLEKRARNEISKAKNLPMVKGIIGVFRMASFKLQKWIPQNVADFAEIAEDLHLNIEVTIKKLDDRLPRFLRNSDFKNVLNVLDQVKADSATYEKCRDLIMDHIDAAVKEYEDVHNMLVNDCNSDQIEQFNVIRVKRYILKFQKARCLKKHIDFDGIADTTWDNLKEYLFGDIGLLKKLEYELKRRHNYKAAKLVWGKIRTFQSFDSMRADDSGLAEENKHVLKCEDNESMREKHKLPQAAIFARTIAKYRQDLILPIPEFATKTLQKALGIPGKNNATQALQQNNGHGVVSTLTSELDTKAEVARIKKTILDGSFKANFKLAEKVVKSASDDFVFAGIDFGDLQMQLDDIVENWWKNVSPALVRCIHETQRFINCEKALTTVKEVMKRCGQYAIAERTLIQLDLALNGMKNLKPISDPTKEQATQYARSLIGLKTEHYQTYDQNKEIFRKFVEDSKFGGNGISNLLKSRHFTEDLRILFHALHTYRVAIQAELANKPHAARDFQGFGSRQWENSQLSNTFKTISDQMLTFEKRQEWENYQQRQDDLISLVNLKLEKIYPETKWIKTWLYAHLKQAENDTSDLAQAVDDWKRVDLASVRIAEKKIAFLKQLENSRYKRKYMNCLNEYLEKALKKCMVKTTEQMKMRDYSQVDTAVANLVLLETIGGKHASLKGVAKQASTSKHKLLKYINLHHDNIMQAARTQLENSDTRQADDSLNALRDIDKHLFKYVTPLGAAASIVHDYVEKTRQIVMKWQLECRSPTKEDLADILQTVYDRAGSLTDVTTRDKIKKMMSSIFQRYCKKNSGINLNDLAFVLTENDRGGEHIVNNFSEFAQYNADMFNDIIGRINADDALRQLQSLNSDVDNKQLDALYNGEEKKMIAGYTQVFERFRTKYVNKPFLQIVKMIRKMAYKIKTGKWESTKKYCAAVIGGISAAWTIYQSRQKHLVMKMHPIQVLTLFRLLGLDRSGKEGGSSKSIMKRIKEWAFDPESKPAHHLTEIETGGGKSIVLGVLATLLAMLGAKVNCACYSAYLSKRDRDAFIGFWEHFGFECGVGPQCQITYSTLKDLANIVLNEGGEVCELAKGFVTTGKLPKAKEEPEKCFRVLLIDEVDVFFKTDFYGNSYNPGCKFTGEKEYEFLCHIYEHRGSNLTKEQITQSVEYKSIRADYDGKDCGWVLEFALDPILAAVKEFKNHRYDTTTRDGETFVAYREHGQLTTTKREGYLTDLAYLECVEQGSIDESTAKQMVGVTMGCGRFSYAMIPKMFNMILGVTGTLKSLSNFEKSVVADEYEIKSQTMTPSLYPNTGLNVFQEGGDTILEMSTKVYHQKIATTINEAVQSERAVLVYFESNADIDAFIASDSGQELEKLKPKPRSVVEKTPNKQECIKQATHHKQVTYLPRVLGRGLDFKCNDRKVNSVGGVLVVQTFFSMRKSEEVQIRGRTARQGKPGRYQLILNVEDVAEQFKLTIDDLKQEQKNKTLYAKLSNVREILSSKEGKKRTDQVAKASIFDQLSKDMSAILQYPPMSTDDRKTQTKDLLRYLKRLNTPSGMFHFVFCLDSSGSMADSSDPTISGSPSRWDAAIAAYNHFLHKLCSKRIGDLVTVISFSSTAQHDFTADSHSCKDRKITNIKGGTDFGPALHEAKAQISKADARFTPVLIFMSDGDGYNKEDIKELLPFKNRNIQVNTIFFGTDSGAENMEYMANQFGKSGNFHMSINGVQLQETFGSKIIPVEITSAVVEYGD